MTDDITNEPAEQRPQRWPMTRPSTIFFGLLTSMVVTFWLTSQSMYMGAWVAPSDNGLLGIFTEPGVFGIVILRGSHSASTPVGYVAENADSPGRFILEQDAQHNLLGFGVQRKMIGRAEDLTLFAPYWFVLVMLTASALLWTRWRRPRIAGR